MPVTSIISQVIGGLLLVAYDRIGPFVTQSSEEPRLESLSAACEPGVDRTELLRRHVAREDLAGADVHIRFDARSADSDVWPPVVGEVHVQRERADVVEA